jgi:hypothetical protein
MVESRQPSGKPVAGSPLKPVAVDTRSFTKETAPIPGQPAPIPTASREQPDIVTEHTQSSIQTVATTTGTLLVSFVCGAR